MATVLNSTKNFLCVYTQNYTHGMIFSVCFFSHKDKVTTYICSEICCFK